MTSPRSRGTAPSRTSRSPSSCGRRARDVRGTGAAGDVASPPRTIEVKAHGRSARGTDLWLETRQVDEARSNPDFYVYVVENVRQGDLSAFTLKVLGGPRLAASCLAPESSGTTRCHGPSPSTTPPERIDVRTARPQERSRTPTAWTSDWQGRRQGQQRTARSHRLMKATDLERPPARARADPGGRVTARRAERGHGRDRRPCRPESPTYGAGGACDRRGGGPVARPSPRPCGSLGVHQRPPRFVGGSLTTR
jgi:hypothetical protein